jgi:hypothetical protein
MTRGAKHFSKLRKEPSGILPSSSRMMQALRQYGFDHAFLSCMSFLVRFKVAALVALNMCRAQAVWRWVNGTDSSHRLGLAVHSCGTLER